MDRGAPIWKFLLILNYVGFALSADCGPCTCTRDRHNMTFADCADKELVAVPDDLPTSTRFLNFSGNRLATENLDGLCNYGFIEVDLTGNHLTSLSSSKFMGCNATRKIDFSDNIVDYITEDSLAGLQDIRTISNLESRFFHQKALSVLPSLRELSVILHQPRLPRTLFKNLNQVETLTIDIRNAFEIPEDIFLPMSSSLTRLTFITKSLPSITQSFLEACRALEMFELLATNLHSVPNTLFRSSRKLSQICMRGILGLPRQLFENLDKLSTLEIHGTEDMPSSLFRGQIQLEYLDLSECAIPKIPDGWFSDLWSVKILNIANVGLKSLRREDFFGLKSLVEVEMEENLLRTLEPISFRNIQSTIKYIGLGSNILKNVTNDTFYGLSKLETLDLHSNIIHSIDGDAFSTLRELQNLNLRDNHIGFLPDGLFHQNVRLEMLDLSSNKLDKIKLNTFKYLESLRILNISDNQLVSVANVLKSVSPALRIIDLSFNNLSCECVSRERVEILNGAQILGYCKMYNEDIPVETFINSAHCFPSTLLSTSWTKSTESTSTLEAKSSSSPVILSTPSDNYSSSLRSSKLISRHQLASTQQVRSSLPSMLSLATQQRRSPLSSSPSSSSIPPVSSSIISSSATSQKSSTPAQPFPPSSLSSSTLLPSTIQSKATVSLSSPHASSSSVSPAPILTPTTLQPLVPPTSTSRPTILPPSSLSSLLTPTTLQSRSTLSSSSPLPSSSSSVFLSFRLSPTTLQSESSSQSASPSPSLPPVSSTPTVSPTTLQLESRSSSSPPSPSLPPVSSTPTVSPTTAQPPSSSSSSSYPLSSTVTPSPLYEVYDISTHSNSQSSMFTTEGAIIGLKDKQFNTTTGSNNKTAKSIKTGLAETSYGFEEKKPSENSYYIAVACISTVSLACIVILVYLWYKRSHRQGGYAVSHVEDQEMHNFIMGSVEVPQASDRNGPVPLKDVPSIQIESVDGENSLHVIEKPNSSK